MKREAFGGFMTHQIYDRKKQAYASADCTRRASPEHGMTVALEAETQGVFIKAYNNPGGDVVHEIYRTCGIGEDKDILFAKIVNGELTYIPLEHTEV